MWTDGEGRTDRQTDVTKLIVAFRNFAYAPKRFGSNLLCLARFSAWRNQLSFCEVMATPDIK